MAINMLLNKYSHMRSVEETLHAINSLVLTYCYTLSVSGPRSTQGLLAAAGMQLEHSLLRHGTVHDAAWRTPRALLSHCQYVDMWDPGLLAHPLSGSVAKPISRKASKGCSVPQDGWWTFNKVRQILSPYSDSRESPLLVCDAGLYSLH